MNDENDRCANHRRFQKIDAAFRAGDLAALRAAVADPDSVPDGTVHTAIGSCLEYAIYHSPLAFIRQLLELGADPNAEDPAGFPPLMAALSGVNRPGAGRAEVGAIVELLLAFGADPNQRGINDYTALHMAVSGSHLRAAERLLAAGADPTLRTRIDECETPREMAETAGLTEMAALLARYEQNR